MPQQLDKIGKDKNPVTITGGISASQLYRYTNQGENADPYSMVINGNITTTLYGFSVPLTFTWSNYKWTYTQPFNQFSLSPSYKWVTLHLGYSSMSFSPYSLSGHTFAGVGVDLAPGDKFKFSAMAGQLQKATPGDSAMGFDPTYSRFGSGFKAEYLFEKAEVGINFFYASDNADVPYSGLDSLGITPMDNLVLGCHFMVRPFQSLTVRADWATSFFSTDKRLSRATDTKGVASNIYHAMKTDVSYSHRIGSLGVGVEYVQPGYQTLGSYYSVNDFINYTVNAATSVANGKVTIAASTGIRENNLSEKSDTKQKDFINNIAIGFNPTDKLNFNINYSNFLNYTYIRTVFDEINAQTQYDLLDTLNFTQISENINLSAAWQFKETEKAKHTLNSSLGFQKATQTQSDVQGNAGSVFTNATGGYQLTLLKAGFSAGLNANYSQNKSDSTINRTIGPLLFVRKQMFDKKLTNSLTLSWNGNYNNGEKTGDMAMIRLSSGYTLKKVHLFNLSLSNSISKRTNNTSRSFTASLTYSYQFGWPKSKENEPKPNNP